MLHLALALLALPWLLTVQSLPHVDECNYCFKCHTGQPPGDIGRRVLGYKHQRNEPLSGTHERQQLLGNPASGPTSASSEKGGIEGHSQGHTQGNTFAAGTFSTHSTRRIASADGGKQIHIMMSDAEWAAKQTQPNCTECYGCTTQIEPIKRIVIEAFGQQVKTDVGASPEWLFMADLPDTVQTGKRAIIKVWCMPYDKVDGAYRRVCANSELGAKAISFLLAQQRVMEDCGLMDVTIKVWSEKVNAVVPGLGFHVSWDGLWMQRAEGVSMHQLAYKTKYQYLKGMLLNLMHERLNRTRVVRAAIYDLLTTQCDRHAENVFMNGDGNLQLIDNLNAMQFSWRTCALDSIFLPGTQKFDIARYGGNWVFKMRDAQPRKSLNPLVLLDYRCYVEGGKLGKNYPPEVKQCLSKLSRMSPQQVVQEYGFPDEHAAHVLQKRASDMLSKGFEWTLKYGLPQSFPPKRNRFAQMCCKMHLAKRGLTCATPWDFNVTVPEGDPKTGGDWIRSYPDIGSYIGGTHLDDEPLA